ncbi:SGNH/GDSL hydrolase family protein [Burkholderia cenocepacia]|uniref:SGNH/GDSL hydrolase family protein n=1 Tax=Burkholderia cenocepacia TaxID=95486 RepID=UPI002864B0EF|nr:SGNH/GDSL hydrolase family protein [Burkholderia cenocepacia]MDR8076713.1 SGNH/GDSL hydrolase family protein [Burkholderia cenocepacia]
MKLKLKIMLALIPVLTLSNRAFASCYVYGDSIAQGVSQQLKQCRADTKIGIGSQAAMNKWGFNPKQEETVIISLGSNDSNPKATVKILNQILEKSDNAKANVFLILPVEKTRRNAIKSAFDGKVSFLNIKSVEPDNVHPTFKGYQALAKDSGLLAG